VRRRWLERDRHLLGFVDTDAELVGVEPAGGAAVGTACPASSTACEAT
jgi:hypothetical protein